MKRHWTLDELVDHWTLLPTELALLANKTGATRLGFAVLLKYFQWEGRFPHHLRDVPAPVIGHLAKQVGVLPESYLQYRAEGRTIEYHRAQIREAFGFRTATDDDRLRLSTWLCDHIVLHDRDSDHLSTAVYAQCRVWHIEPPTPKQIDRLVRVAINQYDDAFCANIMAHLSPDTCAALDALLAAPGDDTGAASEESIGSRAQIYDLKSDPGRLSVVTARAELHKLATLRAIGVPPDLFAGVAPKVLQSYRQRVTVEAAYELRRHAAPLRTTLLAAWVTGRMIALTDTLVELLIDMIHHVGTRAERRVEKVLIADVKRVTGKQALLFQIADASLAHPDGRIKDVIFPVASEQTLRDLVKEWKASGTAYRRQVQTVMRNTYRAHYRQMVPLLLHALTFRSNNRLHQPIIRALDVLVAHAQTKAASYPADVDVPIDGVVRFSWEPLVLEPGTDGLPRVNRINYELCVLQTLREKLRCREVWVEGAGRYRNPDADLPADFDVARPTYYAALQLPHDADAFIATTQQALADELAALNHTLPHNPHVRLLDKGGGWIALTTLAVQLEPVQIGALKGELTYRYPLTPLLDMLKETDLRVGFTDVFTSATGREHLDRTTLQRRLLLCLFGVGTNTGLKRMSAGGQGDSYKDLLYVRRRFLTTAHLRAAIIRVVNATLQARHPHIWGEGTTACASDSKKFGAWDQNLMTEWSIRHRGPGIMIYWHVEKKATCIYSQLKTVSSSEVAAMIEGVQRHCTTMEVEKQYVDSHGQSEVAFAFCRLLGFELLPRLKAIHRQRLYRPDTTPDAYPHLNLILTRPIDWELIRRQYDEMVKYATALRLGTAEAESILRRFTRTNGQHPTYKALIELGKAQKTIFLCRYLRSEPLRREIHEGLNVIETWNSVNSFIFYGKGGDFATNQREEQEVAMLCLHLLQISMGYINTLMIQHVLAEPAWSNRLGPTDLRALTPLVHAHINPYGRFELDLTTRLALDGAAA